MSNDNDFLNTEFQWFSGVVEDVNDPDEINRVRVRAFGYHTDELAQVRTSDLPWATVLLPTTSASISGVGSTPHGLLPGSWVIGFFRDGRYAQDPIVLGSIASQYNSLESTDNINSTKGFKDPTRTFPKAQNTLAMPNPDGTLPAPDLKDVNINARGVNNIIDYIDEIILNPVSGSASQYPHNKVTQTPSGHIIEIDDTPAAERLRVYHKSGTFIEIHPDGSVTNKNGNKWQITIGDDKAHVTGNMEIHVDGNALLNVGGTASVNVAGTASVNVAESASVNVAESATVNCPTTDWTGNINVNGNIEVTGTSTALDHISSGISGSTHQHYDTPGLGAGLTTAPVAEE